MLSFRLPLLSLILLLSCLPGLAQTYFNERYSAGVGGDQSGALSVVAMPTGYAVLGSNNDGVAYRLVFRLLDAQGQLVQEREYARVGESYIAPFGSYMVALPDGGFIAPVSCLLPNNESKPMLWRFNALGDTLWTRSYVLAPRSLALGGCATSDGGYAIVGDIRPASGQRNILLLRTDSAGNMLWHQTYRQRPYNSGESVSQTADGGFLIGGTAYEAGGVPQDAMVFKTDSLGNEQWRRPYGSVWHNGRAVPIPTHDGGYAVLANIGSAPIGAYDQHKPVLFRYDAQGQLLWQRQVGPSRPNAGFYMLHELADGSLVGAGQAGNPRNAQPVGNGIPEGAVFKACGNGDTLWHRTYQKLTGGSSHNYLRDLRPTPDGGFVGAGFLWARAPDTGTNDAWVFKLDSAGYVQAGGAPVTTQCRPVGLPEAEQPADEVLVYPNPSADGRFTLRLMELGAVLTVTDALGRLVWRGAGAEVETRLDLSRQPAGLYLLRLTWPDGRCVSRKLVHQN